MDPNNEVERDRLFRAMQESHRRLLPFRQLSRSLVEDYAGSGYGNEGNMPKRETVVNLMNQAVDAYTMALVANRPRVIISSAREELENFAQRFQIALNNLIGEIQLEQTLRQSVLDAFFSVGVVKVHMADSPFVMLEEGLWVDPGVPFASNVALDNFVYDISATEWHRVRFAGDAYRIPFEDLKADFFDQKVVKTLAPTSKGGADEERLDMISKGFETDDDEIEPMIDLIDVWLPREEKVYTFAIDLRGRFSGTSAPLAEMDWNGPEFGPYKILKFNDVPENIMPTSPASHLTSLSRLANNVLRKQARRARSQTKVHTYTPAGAETAKKIRAASDDQWVMAEEPKEIGEVLVGGVDPQSQAFFLGVVELYDRMAGNLQAVLGLGAQSETVGQEQLIHSSASKKIAQMQYRVTDFTRDIVRDLGHMLWSDAAKVIPARIDVPGAEGFSVDATWTPEQREGDFFDYDLNIDVYSMPYQSPNQRVQSLNYLLTQVYAPLAPILAQQGGAINLQKLTEVYADLLNEPRLKGIVEFTGPPQAGAEEGGAPATTTRQYVRQSVPSGGQQSQSQQQQQQLMSQAPQGAPQ